VIEIEVVRQDQHLDRELNV